MLRGIFHHLMNDHGDRLTVRGMLALWVTECKALKAHTASSRVEFCFRRLFEPHFPPVGADEAKGDRVAGAVDADLMDERLETCTVVRMNPREELGGSKSLVGIKAQDLRSILAAL